jgi:hypothetical protein
VVARGIELATCLLNPGSKEYGEHREQHKGDDTAYCGTSRQELHVRSSAKAIAPNKALMSSFALPTAHHVFLPGHRLMVQVQSS